MAVEWYYQELEQSLGPVSSEQLRGLASQGIITPWTPVRRVSGSDLTPWTRAGEIKKLFDGDVSGQLGKPICEDCGTLLEGDSCPSCSPLEPVQAEDGSSFLPPVGSQDKPSRTTPAEVEERYPNLLIYLGWMKSIAKIVLYLTWAVIAIGVLVRFKNHLSAGDLPTTLFAIFIAAPISALIAYFFFVLTMAGLEFIRVVVDIEENTRRVDVNSR